ncbi:hypothetical protein B0H16DRAFT_1479150 [Mycena metata]|uniref:Uncharacterized protein n=1 Tax=Mycena metata TaxID=1033252 RepID=A0AAD7H5B2_9AGAR|nr:hypothetical protein B0H16DRAFT_1479150 [Mycena metata]
MVPRHFEKEFRRLRLSACRRGRRWRKIGIKHTPSTPTPYSKHAEYYHSLMSVLLFPFEQLLHGPSHTTTAENTYLRAPNFCVARCNLPQFVLVADTTGMKEEFTPAVFRYLSELLNSRFKIGAAGYIILVASRNAALSYFAVYMAACVWVSNNVEGSYKHSVSLAMTVDAKQSHRANGAVSSNVYCAQDKPWYPLGHGKRLWGSEPCTASELPVDQRTVFTSGIDGLDDGLLNR